jgi:hypothetical protein
MPSPAGWRGKKALSSGVAEICLENSNSGDRINSYWCELVNHDGLLFPARDGRDILLFRSGDFDPDQRNRFLEHAARRFLIQNNPMPLECCSFFGKWIRFMLIREIRG